MLTHGGFNGKFVVYLRSICVLFPTSGGTGRCQVPQDGARYHRTVPGATGRCQVPGYMILDPGSRILDPGSRFQDPRSWIQDLGSKIPDPGYRIRDPESWIPDPGSWRSRILVRSFYEVCQIMVSKKTGKIPMTIHARFTKDTSQIGILVEALAIGPESAF